METIEFGALFLAAVAVVCIIRMVNQARKIDYWKTRAQYYETENDCLEVERELLGDLVRKTYGIARELCDEMTGAEWISPAQQNAEQFLKDHNL